MDKNNPLIGKRAVVVHRCSDESQIKDSMDQQRKGSNAFISKYSLVVVKECEAPAVSASLKKHKKLIYELLAMKVRGELDFDIILFADWSRFTRTGRRDGHRILAELADEDIMVVTVKDGLLIGRDGENRTDQSLRDSEAYAESLAHNVSRGVQDSLEKEEIPHTSLTPYGTDRCYVSDDGAPPFILRNSVPGKKLMLDAATREVIKELKHSAEEPAVVKQSSQKITLVKGPPAEVEVVNRIFARRYVDGWGAHRIVKELNELKIPGPRGKYWTTHTVTRIFHNPMYLGTGIANQITNGVYVQRAANFPIEHVERRTPGKRHDGKGFREYLPPIQRPREDNLIVNYPGLADFLDPTVREVARGEIQRWLDRPVRQVKKMRYIQSSFLLSGVLRSKQLDLPMQGTTSTGGGKHTYRYYHNPVGTCKPGIDKRILARMPADPVENEVKAALIESLTDSRTISTTVKKYIEERIDEANSQTDPLPALIADKEKLEGEYRTIHEVYGKRGQDLLRTRSAQLERLLDEVDAKISLASSSISSQVGDTESVIKSVRAQCADAVELLSSEFAGAAKRVVESFISKASFDLETKEVEIEVGLPSWVISAQKTANSQVRGLARSVHPTDNPTHFIFLAKYACHHVRSGYNGSSQCLHCTRLKPAA